MTHELKTKIIDALLLHDIIHGVVTTATDELVVCLKGTAYLIELQEIVAKFNCRATKVCGTIYKITKLGE